MKGLITLVVIVLIGYAGLTGMKQFKTNGDFEKSTASTACKVRTRAPNRSACFCIRVINS